MSLTRWRVQFCPSPLLPGAMRYGRVENKADGMTTVLASRFRQLQAYWRTQYGEPEETVRGAVTVWEFTPVKGQRFDLKPPGEWGRNAGNAAWTDGKECEG